MNNKFSSDFYEGGIFHVYNRTNSKELLFRDEENYRHFLRLHAKYLQPFLDTFCWCLLPTHFHMLVRVKPSEDIREYLELVPLKLLKTVEKDYLLDKLTLELLIESEWKRFFIAYSMCFNTLQSRSGNLFHRPFKRTVLNNDSHFTQAIIYIHANAQRHKLCKKFTDHIWTSWHTMVSGQPTALCREEVLGWFGGLQPFIDAHMSLSDYYYNTDVSLDDFNLG